MAVDVTISGRVSVAGTAGMSVDVGGGVIRDATLMKRFVVCDAPIADATSAGGVVTVTSAPCQVEDARGWRRGGQRVFRQAAVHVLASAGSCTVTVEFAADEVVSAGGPWAIAPTIRVDGVALPVKE